MRTTGTSRWFFFLWLAFPLIAAANIALWYPGVMTHDSFRQYSEAVSGYYTPWHPPIMARLWSYMLPFSTAGSALLIAHIALYWFSLFLIAHTLLSIRRPYAALLVVAIGLSPPFLVMNAFIWKDVGMAVTLLTSFALLFHRQVSGKSDRWILAGAAVLLVYGTLVRSNAIFGAAPLLIFALRPQMMRKPVSILVVIGAIVVVAIPASTLVNRYVLKAHGHAAFKSLMLFDLVGTAHYSRDSSFFTVPVSLALVDHCYSPKWWDPINLDSCKAPILDGTKGVAPAIQSISHHPVAYLEHRFAHFNEAMFGFVASEKYKYEDTGFTRKYKDMPQSHLRWQITDLHEEMQSILIFSPAIFLFLDVIIVIFSLMRKTRLSPTSIAAFYLSLSSLLYFLSFLIVGVANMYRYQMYPIMAAGVAVVLFMSERIARRDKMSRAEIVFTGLGLAYVIALVWVRAVLG